MKKTVWQSIEERTRPGLTFDDVFLIPRPTSVIPRDVITKSLVCTGIEVYAPFLSSPMDKVTEAKMAIAMALFGSIGFLHRGMKKVQMLAAVEAVKRFMAGKITNPIVVSPEMTLSEVKKIHTAYTGFPVIKNGRVVGIITKRDMDGKSPNSLVSGLMTPRKDLITAKEDVSSESALEIMQKHKIEKLPLVSRGDCLVGLITRRDLDRRLKYPNATVDSAGRLRVGVAVSGSNHEAMLDLVTELVEAEIDAVIIDSAHGGSRQIVEAVRLLKKTFPNLAVIGGNVADKRSAKLQLQAGADALRVGVGPGSICTTRIVTGVGVPQLTAISDCRAAVEEYKPETPIIADGGMSEPGHLIKALAAGASTLMFGNLLAGTDESPGEPVVVDGHQVKIYRGMGSKEAMEEYGGERYFQSGEGKLIPEGITGTVPARGKVAEQLEGLLAALRSGMGYEGAKTIPDLWDAEFIKVTTAGLREARPHDLISVEGDKPATRKS